MRFIKIIIFVFLSILNLYIFSEEGTNIAICSEDKTQNSEVSPIAGRAKYFQIYDSSGKLLEVIENPFGIRGMQNGAKVADLMEKKGVKIMVAGKFGPQLQKEMAVRNIKIKEFQGSVKEALDSITGKK